MKTYVSTQRLVRQCFIYLLQITALFIIAKIWKQPKYPSFWNVLGWLHNFVDILQTTDLYTLKWWFMVCNLHLNLRGI